MGSSEATGRTWCNRASYAALGVLLSLGACADSEPQPTSGVESPTSGVPDLAGTMFSDPEGIYEILIRPEWESNHGGAPAAGEQWYVSTTGDSFAENVTIIAGSAGKASLEQWTGLNVEQVEAGFDDFVLIDLSTVEGDKGQSLSRVEYTAEFAGVGIHALVIAAVEDGHGVVASLVGEQDNFSETRESVEPYLLTLQVVANAGAADTPSQP